MPLRDQRTRWNSGYEIIYRVLEHIKPQNLQLLAKELELKDDNLNPDEWQVLIYIRDFLVSFYNIIKATEGWQAILERILPSLDFKAVQFINAIERYSIHRFIYNYLQARYIKLLKYWKLTGRAPVYIAAIILDPTLKYDYFDNYWDPNWQPGIKRAMRLLWEGIYKNHHPIPQQLNTQVPVNNQFFNWMQQRRAPRLGGIDELEQYLNEPPFI